MGHYDNEGPLQDEDYSWELQRKTPLAIFSQADLPKQTLNRLSIDQLELMAIES